MSQPGLLPCIVQSGQRVWLPLCSRTAGALAQAMLCAPTASSPSQTVDQSNDLAARLLSIQQGDPAFAIWCYLKLRSVECFNEADASASIQSIVVNAFIAADSFLGAPTNLEAFQSQWHQLSREPLSPEAACRWLAVASESTDEVWQHAFSDFEDFCRDRVCDSQVDLDYGKNQLDLSLLARQTKRFDQLESSFSETLAEQKLAAMKELAYGLSHEINNPLANVTTRAQTLLRDEVSADRRRRLDAIVSQAMRAFELIADMMYYANPPEPVRKTVDLVSFTRGVLDEFASQWHEYDIAINADLPQELVTVADANQLSDSLRALLRNATESIGSGGTIDLKLRERGEMIELRIADSGAGLTPRESRHAFDPFFSGREAGRGLGLGLCKAQRVAKLHDGDVSLRGGLVGAIAKFWIRAQ